MGALSLPPHRPTHVVEQAEQQADALLRHLAVRCRRSSRSRVIRPPVGVQPRPPQRRLKHRQCPRRVALDVKQHSDVCEGAQLSLHARRGDGGARRSALARDSVRPSRDCHRFVEPHDRAAHVSRVYKGANGGQLERRRRRARGGGEPHGWCSSGGHGNWRRGGRRVGSTRGEGKSAPGRPRGDACRPQGQRGLQARRRGSSSSSRWRRRAGRCSGSGGAHGGLGRDRGIICSDDRRGRRGGSRGRRICRRSRRSRRSSRYSSINVSVSSRKGHRASRRRRVSGKRGVGPPRA